MGINTVTIEREVELSIWERLYLPEIVRGLAITIRHFFSTFRNMRHLSTIEYPEQKRSLPFGYRAEHRLMLRPDGQIRCTACMLCATNCPADCIEIVAEDTGDGEIEKRPQEFIINELRCVFCGYCVEACPCDAIRMDTKRYENSNYKREDFIYNKERLIANQSENGTSPISIGLY